MSPNDPKASSLLSLFPYHLEENDNGYYFLTDQGATYELVFNDDTHYFPDDDFLGPVLSFTIAITDGQPGKKDPRIELTITEAIERAFADNPHTIITYTCSQANNQALVRSVMFRAWFKRQGAGYEKVEHSNRQRSSYAAAFYKNSHPYRNKIKRIFTEVFRDK